MVIIVFSIILASIFILLTITIVLFYKDSKYVPVVVQSTKKSHTPLFECSIEELSKRIATEKLNEVELLQVVDFVAKKHKFPGKSSGEKPDNHLAFIRAFCLNPQTKGSTIVKMSNTLKAINQDYVRDIEKEEKLAIKQRDEEENE